MYFGVLSASVAAIIAILHLKFYDRKQMRVLRQKVKEQSDPDMSQSHAKEVLRELCMVALPLSVIGLVRVQRFDSSIRYSSTAVCRCMAIDSETIIAVTGAINYGVLKLIAIPQILAPGFSAAIIPHLSEALTRNDHRRVRRSIRECVEIVLYIGLPISFCLFAYAKPLYYVMFTTQSLDISAQVLRWYSIEAFFSTIAPIFTSLMMAVGLRYRALKYVGVHFVIKMVLTMPLIAWIGYPGTILSDIVAYTTMIVCDAIELKKRFQVRWKYTLRRLLFMVIATGVLYLVCLFFEWLGFGNCEAGRVMTLVQLAISGGCALLVYLLVSYVFQLPQVIFHIDLKKLLHRRGHA